MCDRSALKFLSLILLINIRAHGQNFRPVASADRGQGGEEVTDGGSIIHVGGKQFPTLATALASAVCGTSSGCRVEESNAEHWTANPFASLSTNAEVQIDLGCATYLTDVEVLQPPNVHVTGCGGATGTGTVIKASRVFPANTPIWRIGTGSGTFVHNSFIERLAIDCSGRSGTTGLYSTQWNEKSGGRDLVIINCPANGVWSDGGRGLAQSFALSQIEIYPNQSGNYATSSTTGVKLVGEGNGPAELRDITVNGAGGTAMGNGVALEDIAGGVFTWIHCEYLTNACLEIGDATNASNALVAVGISGGNGSAGDVVQINNSSANFSLFNIIKGTFTNTIRDIPRSSINTDRAVEHYQVGSGGIGSETILTSTAAQGNTFVGPHYLLGLSAGCLWSNSVGRISSTGNLCAGGPFARSTLISSTCASSDGITTSSVASCISATVTIPSTGSTFRILASYTLYVTSATAPNGMDVWVSDGTNTWAGSEYSFGASLGGPAIAAEHSELSPVTYRAGAGNVTVTLMVQDNTGRGTLTAATTSLKGSQPSHLQLEVIPTD